MQQHGSKYFACRSPSPTLGMGSVRQNSTFSEHGHVTYQIKENQKCSNMVATNLPADPPPPPMGSKGQISSSFQNMVMLHIKLNRITNAGSW